MVKSRKSKYILVVAMALCLVMAFSASAFAGIDASTVFEVGGSILMPDERVFINLIPAGNVAGIFGINPYFKYIDGLSLYFISDLHDFQNVLSIAHNEYPELEFKLVTYDSINTFYSNSQFYNLSYGENSSVSAQNLKNDMVSLLNGYNITFIYSEKSNQVVCDSRCRPYIYAEYVSSPSQNPLANYDFTKNVALGFGSEDRIINAVVSQLSGQLDAQLKFYLPSIQNELQIQFENLLGEFSVQQVEQDTDTGEITIVDKRDYSSDDSIEAKSYIGGDNTGVVVDTNTGLIVMPDGSYSNIEDYHYDETNNQYVYQTTYNTEHYYITQQFYYDYTYVVYLGSSEEYKPEAYKFYYELPDGRSSADLTADELAGMSVQFADVVTYDRAASDEVVEGLWHLDGSLENTAFNNNSQMYFNSGASISYIEDAGFEGALYLPALNGAREWWNNIGISTDNGTVLPQSVQDYFSSIFTYPHDQLYSSNVKSYNINDNSFNFSVDFRFYNYADANDSTGTMFTYQPYFNQILETSRSPFVGTLSASSLSIFKIDFLGSSLKFYNQAGTNTTTVSYSPGTWNHILVNYSFQLGRYGQNSSVGGSASYSITYLPSVTVYLNGVLVYSFESTSDSVTAINNTFQSSTNYNTAVNYFINGNKFPSALQGVKFSSSSNTVPFAIDEIRITDTNVPNLVSPVPYEDNLVWVLPDSTNLAANTLAIQSDYLSGKYRVGGIRPSMVEKGHVWFQISMNRIVSCQVYNGIMWEEVNCYVWTGSRWIPANYFDVVTLTDYYDIADNTGLPTITTSEGFFSWFQREFKEFKDKAIAFFDAWEGGSGGQGGSTNNNVTIIAPSLTANGTLDANISVDNKFEFDLGTNAGDVLQGGFEGVSGVFRGMWQLGGGFFDLVGDGVTYLFNYLIPTGSSDFINNPVEFWYLGFN